MARTDLTLVRPPTTLVDACVILDLTTNDPKWADWSEEAIALAAVSGNRLLTRDSARYSNYFPTVPLLTP